MGVEPEQVPDLAELVLAGADLPVLFDAAVREAREKLGASTSALFEWAPERGVATLRAGAGWNPGVVGEATLPDDEGTALGHCLRRTRPARAVDVEAQAGFSRTALCHAHGILSALTVPVPGRERIYGVLAAFSDLVGAFSEDDLHYLTGVGALFAMAIQRTQTHELERLAREQSVRAHRDFKVLVDALPVGVTVMRGGKILYANAALAGILGFSGAHEAVGISAIDFVHPDDVPVMRERLRRLEAGEEVPSPRETRFVRTDGSQLTIETTLAGVIEYEGSPATLNVARDLTQHNQMQAQLLVSDRMASMGMLAAGVAHEINNPLTAILMNVEAAADSLRVWPEDPAERREVAEMLADTQAASERVRDIVRDLKLFSRASDDAVGPVEPQRVMESTLRMAWNEVRHRAKLVRDYRPSPTVQANESRLGQVFLNLVVNAAQAIPDGDAAQNEIRVTVGSDPKGWAFIEIADSGAGMTPEVRRRLFTPFFTTKPVGVGTGLGLSIVYRTVTNLGGRIEVESEAGNGTRFRIFIPPSPDGAGLRQPLLPAPLPAVRRGRILIVDDDLLVARAVSRTLGSEHDVVLAGDAASALERILGGERFDVILCDVMMPKVTGPELATAIGRFDPAQAGRVVFITAGAFTPESRAALDKMPQQQLDKPIDAARLRAVVNEFVERG